jgi:hypothetical protein
VNTDIGGLIIGVIALIGTLHYTLANDLLRDLSEIGAKFLSKKIKIENNKEKEIIIKNCRKVFAFLAISNHIVELVFSFLVGYCLFCILTQTSGENNQKSYLSWLLPIIAIILLLLYIYVFKRLVSDFKLIRKFISQWFPNEEGINRFDPLLSFLIVASVILFLILFITYCYVAVFPLFHHGQTEPIKRFLILSTIVAFGIWWFSFKLKPLTRMFELRQKIFSKNCQAENQK